MSVTASNTESDCIEAFRSAMAQEGISYSGPIIGDGKIHRFQVDDDRKGRRNGFYLLHLDARPAGFFGCNKRYGNEKKFSWSAKRLAPMSAAEREDLRRRMEEVRVQRAAEEKARHQEGAALANRLWEAAKPVEAHPYLLRKGVKSHGLRLGRWEKPLRPTAKGEARAPLVIENALLVPLRYGKDIVSLQAIFDPKTTIFGEERDKDFITGGRKVGCCWPIGEPTEIDGKLVVLIGEGYATCASVHEATGLGCLVAFDAGNLLPVAERARKRHPDALICILADNDQFTTISGVPTNVGINKAKVAAEKVGARLAVPWFSDVSGRPSDFNDLHKLAGVEEVRRQVMAVLVGDGTTVSEVNDLTTSHDAGEDSPTPTLPEGLREPTGRKPPFTILGCDEGRIFFYHHEREMLIARKDSAWTIDALTSLAPLEWWQAEFSGKGPAMFDRAAAVSSIQREAWKKGAFDPERLRGVGAWRTSKGVIFHAGDRLFLEGRQMPLGSEIRPFLFVARPRSLHPGAEALTTREGVELVRCLGELGWREPQHGPLVAGWLAMAPLAGALSWRPHIWITGGPGSGKTTIAEFLSSALGSLALHVQNTTEAGLRQRLKSDARPVIADEAEASSERERLRTTDMLALARQCSSESGATMLRGSSSGETHAFQPRISFCLCSVQFSAERQADVERFTKLELVPKELRTPELGTSFRVSMSSLNGMLKRGLPERLLARGLYRWSTVESTLQVFKDACAGFFGSSRAGDQLGTLFGGAWSLIDDDVPTPEQALSYVEQFEWHEDTDATVGEGEKVLSALLQSRCREQPSQPEYTVREYISWAAGVPGPASKFDADALLRRRGIRVSEDRVWIARDSHAVAETLPQGLAVGWVDQLRRLPGAEVKPFRVWPQAQSQRSISLPLALVLATTDGA